MRILTTIAAARTELDGVRAGGGSVGLVPTMGFLHAGHQSLIQRSAADCDRTMATIFVNPLQFGPDEDFEAYPRDVDRDAAMCADAGADFVLAPSVDEMYPIAPATVVEVPEVASQLEGRFRPTHFAGVATVVAKLFNIAGACRAYFGEKDFQQLAIIRRMAFDLSCPVDVVGCPIVREPDGLAMSSRNVYLTDDERAAAVVLSGSLRSAVGMIDAGERDPGVVLRALAAPVEAEPLARLDYADIVDSSTLLPVSTLDGELRLLVAAWFGQARLIDNMGASA